MLDIQEEESVLETEKALYAPSEKAWQVFQNLAQLFLRSIFGLLTKYGLPGIALFMGYYFLVTSGSEIQKQEMVERWFLDPLRGEYLSIGIWMVVLVLIFWGQQVFFRRKVKAMEDRNSKLEEQVRICTKFCNEELRRSNFEVKK